VDALLRTAGSIHRTEPEEMAMFPQTIDRAFFTADADYRRERITEDIARSRRPRPRKPVPRTRAQRLPRQQWAGGRTA
jgi:hypothetical protein